MSSALVLATSTRGSGGGLATAASLAVAAALGDEPAASRINGHEIAVRPRGALLIELGADGRGPTLLASDAARSLETELDARLAAAGSDPAAAAGARPAARGRICWLGISAPGSAPEQIEALKGVLALAPPVGLAVLYMPAAAWIEALSDPALDLRGGLVRADLPRDRSLAALAVTELRERGLRARVATRALGRVGARRAIAGLEPGGAASVRARRWLRGLAPAMRSQRGQSLPLVLGVAFLLVFSALIAAAIGGAVGGRSRLQRAADLAAISAVRSLRDDVDRLLAPAREPDGSPNPAHLDRRDVLDRARDAALTAAERNGLDAARLRISFPDSDATPPLTAETNVGDEVSARAEALAPSGFTGATTMATGGGYSGPLVYRQGKPMRPDVALAFDEMAAFAAADGITLTITSAFRSDAEQAALFAANPDPMWVAPPGTSLHRCATELDLSPPSAYGWLAANASRFGFALRYSWEPWHAGYDGGPPPCSEAGDQIGLGTGADAERGGEPATAGLPSFVPAQFREPLMAAAARWNVSAGVLAAQLEAESGFNPSAVSPAGAQGIAQFMPGTAASYGLSDPFDADAAIDAQAHLMSDLLAQFGSLPLALAAYNAGPGAVAVCTCVPPYPETQAYVARILSLLDGTGELAVPSLEVKLVA